MRMLILVSLALLQTTFGVEEAKTTSKPISKRGIYGLPYYHSYGSYPVTGHQILLTQPSKIISSGLQGNLFKFPLGSPVDFGDFLNIGVTHSLDTHSLIGQKEPLQTYASKFLGNYGLGLLPKVHTSYPVVNSIAPISIDFPSVGIKSGSLGISTGISHGISSGISQEISPNFSQGISPKILSGLAPGITEPIKTINNYAKSAEGNLQGYNTAADGQNPSSIVDFNSGGLSTLKDDGLQTINQGTNNVALDNVITSQSIDILNPQFLPAKTNPDYEVTDPEQAISDEGINKDGPYFRSNDLLGAQGGQSQGVQNQGVQYQGVQGIQTQGVQGSQTQGVQGIQTQVQGLQYPGLQNQGYLQGLQGFQIQYLQGTQGIQGTQGQQNLQPVQFLPSPPNTPALQNPSNNLGGKLGPVLFTPQAQIGSGGLGVVRLPTGMLALGSGSLGYVGNPRNNPSSSGTNSQPMRNNPQSTGSNPQLTGNNPQLVGNIAPTKAPSTPQLMGGFTPLQFTSTNFGTYQSLPQSSFSHFNYGSSGLDSSTFGNSINDFSSISSGIYK